MLGPNVDEAGHRVATLDLNVSLAEILSRVSRADTGRTRRRLDYGSSAEPCLLLPCRSAMDSIVSFCNVQEYVLLSVVSERGIANCQCVTTSDTGKFTFGRAEDIAMCQSCLYCSLKCRDCLVLVWEAMIGLAVDIYHQCVGSKSQSSGK